MLLINKMLSSNSTNEDFPTCSLFLPPSPPPPPHLDYQDVYLEFLQLFYEQDSAPAKAKSAKKDRHSKINTARGPRDRRMRLSLDIARRFFHLQDLLGYDKASTTVHWLLEHAGAAIAELEVARGGHPHPHPTSEHSSTCEQPAATTKVRREREREKEKVKKRVAVARESRRKARERARERTSQKRLLIQTQPNLTPLNYDDHVEEGFKKSTTLFTYDHQPTFFNQDEQIAEFEFGGKPWEDFNRLTYL